MKNKIASLIITCSLVMGACVPAFAAPTTADQYAQYSGTGWSYNSSSHNFIANNQLSNSVPYVILSYLRDMYSQLSFDNSGYGYSYSNNTMRGIDITGSGKTSGGLYNIGKLIGLLNTNLMSQFVFTTNANEVPLYSWKNFIDTNLYSWSFSNDDFIDNFVNGIASVNNNVAYIANQLYSDSSNNRSLINQAFHSIVTNLDILSDIDNNTDGLESINTDIKNNTGYIYTESQGIHSDTSDIKSINSNIYSESQGIHSDTTDIKNIINKTLNPNWTFLNRQTPTGNIGYQSRQGYTYPTWSVDSALGSYRYSYSSSSNSLVDLLSNLNLLANFTSQEIMTPYTVYRALRMNNRTGNQEYVTQPNGERWNAVSVMDLLSLMQNTIDFQLGTLTYFFADADTISAKRANSSQTSTVLNNFTGSGSASASVSDFTAVADSVGDVKSGVNTNVSVSNILGVFNSSDGYGWFSSETANDIDQVNDTNTRLLRSNRNSEYPLVSQRLNELYSVMGVLND